MNTGHKLPVFLSFLSSPFFQPEVIFLIFAIPFGLIYCLATAPFQVPDEFAHFYRAYQISQLKFVPEARSEKEVGGQLPANFSLLEDTFIWMTKKPASKVPLTTIDEYLHTPLNSKETKFFVFKNSAIYAPAGYLPQAIGLFVGRQFNVSLLGEFYLGRIVNVISWIVLTYLAIRKMPVLKWALFVTALMPMTITQAASLSIDGLLNSLSFLLIALILRTAFLEAEKPNWGDFVLWTLLLTLITLSKSAYIILGGLIFLIPFKKTGPWKIHLLRIALIFGIPFFSYVAWIKLLSLNGINMSVDNLFNPGLQIQWMINHGLLFARIFIQNYARMALPLIVSGIGYLGWLNQPLPVYIYPLFIIFLFYTVLFDHHYPQVTVHFWQRTVILVVVLASLFTIATAIYIISNPVAHQQIEGIQGRYFIPIVPLCSLLIYNKVIRLPRWILQILVPLLSFTTLVLTVQAVLSRIQF